MNIFSIIARNKWFFILYALLLTGGFYYLSHYSKADGFLQINRRNDPAADTFFKYFTNLGDGLIFVALIVIFFFVNRWYALVGLWSFAASSLIVQIIKQLLLRDTLRPRAFFEHRAVLHFIDGVTVHSLGSFPSGHTATAFSVALWLAYLSTNKYMSALYLIPAVFVGYSRIYLSQHFPEDVVAGSLIGIFTTLIVIAVMEWRRNKKR